jgi:hypothetical protein
MKNRPTLPPQAYTRETLSTAFQWLQHQPEHIKKLAQTPDALVGIYMRAMKFGNASPEADAPVSSQTFFSDLKNLTEAFKQTEQPRPEPKPDTEATSQVRQPPPSSSGFSARFKTEALNMAAAATAATTAVSAAAFAGATTAPLAQAPAPVIAGTSQSLQPVVRPHEAASERQAELAHNLNAASQAMLEEVKKQLNLTSDAEALNMMVAVAYKSLKNLIA